MSELPAAVPTVAAERDTIINPNVPISSTTTTITETETRGPRTFLPMDHLLDPLQQPPEDHKCGYMFWK